MYAKASNLTLTLQIFRFLELSLPFRFVGSKRIPDVPRHNTPRKCYDFFVQIVSAAGDGAVSASND